jgi:hypothetical protein
LSKIPEVKLPPGFSATVPGLATVKATQLAGKVTWSLEVTDIKRLTATSPADLRNSIAGAVQTAMKRPNACCCCCCCCVVV